MTVSLILYSRISFACVYPVLGKNYYIIESSRGIESIVMNLPINQPVDIGLTDARASNNAPI